VAAYSKMCKDELKSVLDELVKVYKDYQAKNLKLDMSRGKPNSDQLDLCEGLLTSVSTSEETKINGVDTFGNAINEE